MFNREKLEELQERVDELEKKNQELSDVAVLEAVELQRKIDDQRRLLATFSQQVEEKTDQLTALHDEIVETSDIEILQEVGVYQFSHVLESAVAYQDRLKDLQSRIKEANRAGGNAVTGTTNWTVNGSKPAGERMVREVSKLMLRAYNGEVDDAVRTLKPYKIDAAIDRLNKVRASIEKLGKSMTISITQAYHQLRVEELRLTADFLAKQAEEKEAQREERERLREEAQAQKELKAEAARLAKERSHYENVLTKATESGNEEAIAEAQVRISEIDGKMEDVEKHAANIRAGYVYVISNVGSFGGDVVKIGMTRRLEWQERIHELSNASVPFIFDTHAVIFSNDAVTLEKKLHEGLDATRVNRVNSRKEFFRTPPSAVKSLLEDLAGSHLLEYHEVPEAVEWRISTGSGDTSAPVEQARGAALLADDDDDV